MYVGVHVWKNCLASLLSGAWEVSEILNWAETNCKIAHILGILLMIGYWFAFSQQHYSILYSFNTSKIRNEIIETTRYLHSCKYRVFLLFNPILHGLFQVGSTRRGGGGTKAFFSETVKATAIKLNTVTN